MTFDPHQFFAEENSPPAPLHLGWRLIDFDFDTGWIKTGFDPKPEFLNPSGNIQGGFISAMLDDTLGLPKMISGEWTGTMNLTEPHCGTDLGLLKTKAVPNADGSYKITGQKIFISAGEHDMSDNIIHLCLSLIHI